MACVEPACVEHAWPAWNLSGLRGTCVEPAWPAWNLRAWHLRGLRATCVAPARPARHHLHGKTRKLFIFSAWNSKNCKNRRKRNNNPKNDCSVHVGRKNNCSVTWGFLRVAPPTQKIGKVLPSCPQKVFSPKMFFGLDGLGRFGRGVLAFCQ